MKKFSYLAMAIIAVCMSSCGGSKEGNNESDTVETFVVKPETTEIKGDLSANYEVVDKEYTIDSSDPIISVEVKRTDAPFAFNTKGYEPYGVFGQGVEGCMGFGIELLDELGNVIVKKAPTETRVGMYSTDDMKEAIKLKPGETCTVRWNFYLSEGQKPAKFRLTSAAEENAPGSGSSDSDDSSDSNYSGVPTDGVDVASIDSYGSDDSDSSDWDSVLEEYEEYVDSYISCVKKAAKGDADAISEYPSLLESAQELSSKLQSAKGSMTSSQLARYKKITAKMAKAASSM